MDLINLIQLRMKLSDRHLSAKLCKVFDKTFHTI